MSAFEFVVYGLIVLFCSYCIGLELLLGAIRAYEAIRRWQRARLLGRREHRFRGTGWGSRR